MTSEPDIYGTASDLNRDHGENAALDATRQADKFLEGDKIAASAVSRRALKAVKEIQREKPENGDAVN